MTWNQGEREKDIVMKLFPGINLNKIKTESATKAKKNRNEGNRNSYN